MNQKNEIKKKKPSKEQILWESNMRKLHPNSYDKINKYYNSFYIANKKYKTTEHVNKIVAIIKRYENFVKGYQYHVDKVNYNIDDIYRDYYQQISNDKEDFIEDLVDLFQYDYINLFIPHSSNDCLYITDANNSFPKNSSGSKNFLKDICELSDAIKKEKISIKAAIYFTQNGDNYQKDKLPFFLFQSALIEQNKLNKSQVKLQKRMDSYNKELISIVAIILTIVPIIAINVTELKKITIENLLATNGCLIVSIITIVLGIDISFFKLKGTKYFGLIALVIVGFALIILSVNI